MRIIIPNEYLIYLYFAANMIGILLIAGFIAHYRRLKKAVKRLPNHLS